MTGEDYTGRGGQPQQTRDIAARAGQSLWRGVACQRACPAVGRRDLAKTESMSNAPVLLGVLLAVVGFQVGGAAAQQPATRPAGVETEPAPPGTQPAPLIAPETPEQPYEAPPTPDVCTSAQRLHFDELLFDLGFEAQADRRKVRSRVYDRYLKREFQKKTTAGSLQETVDVYTGGWAFGERVLRFDVGARWGLSQNRFSEVSPAPDITNRPHGDVLEYDLKFKLFPRGVVSATAFASQLDSRVPRPFLPSLDRTQERYGTSVFVNSPTFPMRFSFEHLWENLTSRTRELNDEQQYGDDRFEYEGTWQISERQSLRLEYRHYDYTERYSGTRTQFNTSGNYLLANHTLRFGPDDRSSLETLARLQDESGDLEQDIAEVSSRLRLQHTDSFATNYAVQFLRNAFHELQTETYRGEAGLTHQLGECLTSTLQFYGLKQDANKNADFTEWNTLANLAFSKPNPLGRFSANLSYNHTATDASDNNRRGIVIAESVTFRDPLPAFLAQTDVDITTLVVTDSTRARVFLPVRDFIVLKLGRYTALQRVPTGMIQDRQTVLVTYTYRVSSNYDVRRDRVDFRMQQEFKCGLTPYYAGSMQNEDVTQARFLRFEPRNVNRHRLGATYRRPRWSVGGEYEYNDDAIEPYQAVHFNGDVVLLQKLQHQLDGKATLSRFWFDDSYSFSRWNDSGLTWAESVGAGRWTSTLLDLGAAYRYLVRRDLEASASAMYRYQHDSIFGDTHGVDLSAAVEWRIGYFSLRFEAEYDVLDLPDSLDHGASFWIKLKREIPVIARTPQ